MLCKQQREGAGIVHLALMPGVHLCWKKPCQEKQGGPAVFYHCFFCWRGWGAPAHPAAISQPLDCTTEERLSYPVSFYGFPWEYMCVGGKSPSSNMNLPTCCLGTASLYFCKLEWKMLLAGYRELFDLKRWGFILVPISSPLSVPVLLGSRSLPAHLIARGIDLRARV